ncbi:MAG: LysR family transcriptional regulator [Bacteriovoracaceae bacterium]|jgi:LysR family transcriptional regulator, cell division regulator|nr:LysR family transcriptional regulator [Bacteriovoracaceae bacterium]
MMPNLNDLKYFVEVANSKNLSRAAERLGISQPSLSLAIKRLEQIIGVDILIRTKRGVYLTTSGKVLLTNSKSLIQKWEEIRDSAFSSSNEIKGRFSIGCHPSVALYTLKYFVPEIVEKYQELELCLKHDLSRKISEEVISLNLDLGIVVNPVRHPDLIISKLCEDQVTLWTSGGKAKCLDHKSGSAVLIYDPELVQSQSLVKKLKRKGISFSRTITSSNLEVITSLTAQGAGIGIIPTRVATNPHEGGVKLKQLPGAPSYKDEISVIYRVENKNTAGIRFLSDSIKDFFK